MRFVSKHANYMFVARPDKIQMVLGSGGMMMPQTVEAAIMCQFQHGMVRPDECEPGTPKRCPRRRRAAPDRKRSASKI